MSFKIGDKVRLISSNYVLLNIYTVYTVLDVSTSTLELSLEGMHVGVAYKNDVEKVEEEYPFYPGLDFDLDDESLFDEELGDLILPTEERKASVCECGADSCGGGIHSDWCPLYKEDE